MCSSNDLIALASRGHKISSADLKKLHDSVINSTTKEEEECSKVKPQDKRKPDPSIKGDWTDKTTSSTKRGKVLPDGVVLKLMKKSDWEGLKRFTSNVSFIMLNALAIHRLGMLEKLRSIDLSVTDDLLSLVLSRDMVVFAVLYLFYGFQMQCMAFAGGHELLHGNAFKSKWLNLIVTFSVSTAFFEVLWHERINHKQHHIHTLCIDNDPELTSFYSREEMENPNFRSAPSSRFDYIKRFVNVLEYFEHRICRLISSALGIVTDYTGLGWSMKSPKPTGKVVHELQLFSILQLAVYCVVFAAFGRTVEGWQDMFYWWLLPNLLGYAPINYFRNAEHADCDLRHVTPNQLHNTRTVESNFIVRHLLWNTNYHAEHHAYPMVPFYNLPKLHELLDEHIKHNECKTFTHQNWNYVKLGGWIDKQNN